MVDEILRGAGRTGAIGMSAIDGLIAALVAVPSFVHPEEWIPLIFGGRQPLHENSPELHAVKTIAAYLLRPDTYVALADASGAPATLDRYCADHGISRLTG